MKIDMKVNGATGNCTMNMNMFVEFTGVNKDGSTGKVYVNPMRINGFSESGRTEDQFPYYNSIIDCGGDTVLYVKETVEGIYQKLNIEIESTVEGLF